MYWQDAIKYSQKGTATRVKMVGYWKYTYVRYSDGSGYRMPSLDGKVDFNRCRNLSKTSAEIEGYTDWESSK